MKYPKRMEVWYASLPLDKRTSIQGGSRPVLIVSNDTCNTVSSVVTVVPLTSQMKHLNQPTHVVLELEEGGASLALAEQIMSIDKQQLDRRIGMCSEPETVAKIEAALKEQLGMTACC